MNIGVEIFTFHSNIGAVVEREDFIDSKAGSSGVSTLDSLKMEASASFGYMFFKIDGSITSDKQVNETRRKAYEESLHHVEIRTSGGPSVNRLMAGEKVNRVPQQWAELSTLSRTCSSTTW